MPGSRPFGPLSGHDGRTLNGIDSLSALFTPGKDWNRAFRVSRLTRNALWRGRPPFIHKQITRSLAACRHADSQPAHRTHTRSPQDVRLRGCGWRSLCLKMGGHSTAKPNAPLCRGRPAPRLYRLRSPKRGFGTYKNRLAQTHISTRLPHIHNSDHMGRVPCSVMVWGSCPLAHISRLSLFPLVCILFLFPWACTFVFSDPSPLESGLILEISKLSAYARLWRFRGPA